MALYWVETAVIGVYNVFKMLLIDAVGGLFMGAFFTVHFGMFMFVHGVFLTAFFFAGMEGGIDDDPFVLVRTVRWEVLLLVVSHGISFVLHWMLGDEREGKKLPQQMGAPYGRIVIMHVSILFGGWMVMALGEPAPVLILFVVLKTVVDLRAHVKEHATSQPASGLPHTSAP